MLRVLVSGGGGFIGSHVAEYYLTDGETEVVIFDNLSRTRLIGKIFADPMFNWNYLRSRYRDLSCIKGDVRNFTETKRVAKGVDAIIHTAAQVAVTTSIKDPRTDFEVNALGTFNILEAARLNDSALVFCSTNKVYGENTNRIRIKEEETRYRFDDKRFIGGIPEDFSIDLTSHSPYGCSKAAADLYVQDYAHTYGLKTGVFRMSCIYGERQFGVEDQGWVSWFVIATMTGKPLTIYGDGKQVRDVLFVKDLVKAFDSFLNSELKHEVFNVGGGPQNSLSLLELLDLVKKRTGKDPILSFSEWRRADQKVYISNISKIKNKLKWKPEISPEEGVSKLIEWGRNTFRIPDNQWA